MTQSTLNVVAFTHRGVMRRVNEDCIGIGSHTLASDMSEPILDAIALPTALFVADGLGGHGHGARASRTSVTFLQSQASSLTESKKIHCALNALHQNLLELDEDNSLNRPMGTTIAGAIIRPRELLTFNLGDTRAYLHSYDQLIQISHDDSPTSMAVRAQGTKHLVTQSIGGTWFAEAIDPHFAHHPALRPGERLLLCSDGLTRMVGDVEIEHVFNTNCSIQTVIQKLITAVFVAGAKDNVSIVIAQAA